MTKAQWFVAGAAVSFVVAWLWFTIPRSDSTFYDCWNGQALPAEYQRGADTAEALIDLRGVGRFPRSERLIRARP